MVQLQLQVAAVPGRWTISSGRVGSCGCAVPGSSWSSGFYGLCQYGFVFSKNRIGCYSLFSSVWCTSCKTCFWMRNASFVVRNDLVSVCKQSHVFACTRPTGSTQAASTRKVLGVAHHLQGGRCSLQTRQGEAAEAARQSSCPPHQTQCSVQLPKPGRKI